ncbi:MAG: flagellar biosynthesis protein FliQ [Spirochaetota bacterium]|nr:flagellar biosynthesis protein FliQ [Spirochaetota bacterium]
MSDADIINLMKDALIEILIVGAPILGVSMIVGLIVSIFQTTTSIQEQTLTFVPKIIAIFAAIIFFASWMINHISTYTENLFKMISYIGR